MPSASADGFHAKRTGGEWEVCHLAEFHRAAIRTVSCGLRHYCHRSAIQRLVRGDFQRLTPLATECHGSAGYDNYFTCKVIFYPSN